MNFLGHAILSGKGTAITAGNMAGDFFKGPLQKITAPQEIIQGIALHRFIDTLTDAHPSAKTAGTLFRQETGKYTPVITDILWDYFIANDRRLFTGERQLKLFTQEVYRKIDLHLAALPASFRQVFPNMSAHDWLSNYQNPAGIQRSIDSVNRRARFQEIAPQRVWTCMSAHFDEMQQLYSVLRDDLTNACAGFREKALPVSLP